MDHLDENENKEEKFNIKDLIIRIVLIIVIILLLVHNCTLLKEVKNAKNDSGKYPTGNIDIFEIRCDSSSCENKKNGTNDGDSGKNGNGGNESQSGDSSTVTDTDFISIIDDDIIWSSTNKLRIFENPAFNMESKIAPESSNTYNFRIKNVADLKVRYQVHFNEENRYHLAIRYRLKRDGVYISGNENNWVSYDQLDINKTILEKDSIHNYSLDWKWVSGDDDTSVANIQSVYSLTIDIEAESINE